MTEWIRKDQVLYIIRNTPIELMELHIDNLRSLRSFKAVVDFDFGKKPGEEGCMSDDEDKELYEGDDVIVQEPWQIEKIEGYSGAFCECGHVLHIKTPKRKAFHRIKCPVCGFGINLFCGEIGENLGMDYIREITPNIGELGD